MDLHHLRQDLTAYTRETIAARLGHSALAALDRDIAVPASLAARSSSEPVALLTRLFWLGETLTDDELARALPVFLTGRVTIDDVPIVAGCPLLSRDDDGWRAGFQIVPFTSDSGETGENSGTDNAGSFEFGLVVDESSSLANSTGSDAGTLWFASDLGSLQGARHGEHHVMGVGGASRTLASLARYERGQSVFDLGTGCGVHAIVAASRGAQATASDISLRALEFAKFNAELNGVFVDVREGSLFAPVEGEQFDVVVSNPPFVITPGAVRDVLGTMEYRDGGEAGDSLAKSVVRDVERHLRPGGRAWMLSNWEIPVPKEAQLAPPWFAHPQQWLEGTGLDAMVIQREHIGAEQYVEMWLRDGGLRPGDADFARTYAAWLNDFRARSVSAVGFGYLLLGTARQLSETETPQRLGELQATQQSGEAEISSPLAERAPARMFQELRGAAPENLAAYFEPIWESRYLVDSPEALLDARLVQADLTEHRFYMPGEEEPWLIKFTQLTGFGEEVQADTALAGFVSVCDGDLTVGQIIGALAQLLGAEDTELRDRTIPRVIEMIRFGMLTVLED